jgi:hypothetical protein
MPRDTPSARAFRTCVQRHLRGNLGVRINTTTTPPQGRRYVYGARMGPQRNPAIRLALRNSLVRETARCIAATVRRGRRQPSNLQVEEPRRGEFVCSFYAQ